jgi:hypothetical protein
MKPRKNGERVQRELLRLKEKVTLLEGLCGEERFSDESTAAVKAAARDIRKHVDRIAAIVELE